VKEVLDGIEKEDVYPSDVWRACMDKTVNDYGKCVGVMWGLSAVFNGSMFSYDDITPLPLSGDYDELFYRWVQHLLNTLGARVNLEYYYKYGLTHGVDRMVLDGMGDIVVKYGLDISKWLDACNKMYNLGDCVRELEHIIHELKNSGKI